jgi:transcriptional regulator
MKTKKAKEKIGHVKGTLEIYQKIKNEIEKLRSS